MENIKTLNIKFIYNDNNHSLTLTSTDILSNLKQKIKETIEKENQTLTINPDNISIKMGFPPMTIEGVDKDEKTLQELKISNNEQLRVEIKNISIQKIESISSSTTTTGVSTNKTNPKNDNNLDNTQKDPIDYSKYSIYRKIIAADNSCLFNSINYAVNQCLNEPEIMRELIAVEIQSNPHTYNSAILDKDPDAYCNWIMDKESWGGGIELAILSKVFQIKIGVADVKNCFIEYFGDFPNVIYLFYDGIHYDIFIQKQKNGKESGVFLSTDENIKNEVLAITKEFNKLDKFTDTSKYSIKCNVCYSLFKGNDDAVAHSKSTGHTNFVQV